MQNHKHEAIRVLLCRLGDCLRTQVQAARVAKSVDELAAVARETAADTIFAIDRVGDEALVSFLKRHWPGTLPVEVVMEGLESGETLTEDQYASTGSQIYELLAGRDRMVADLRPLVFRSLGYEVPLSSHPYDICTSLLLPEAGGVVMSPVGARTFDAPLDTTTPVAWVDFANGTLAGRLAPLLREVLIEAGLGSDGCR